MTATIDHSLTSLTPERALRNALGRFATGVAVVTTLDTQGNPIGLTINSFASLSLDPPLVLWSLGLKARSLPIFDQSNHFAVSVLATDQKQIAQQFTGQHSDRFAGVQLQPVQHGMPVIAQCAAWFVCQQILGQNQGDHRLFIGQVLQHGLGMDAAHHPKAPLLYVGGQYVSL